MTDTTIEWRGIRIPAWADWDGSSGPGSCPGFDCGISPIDATVDDATEFAHWWPGYEVSDASAASIAQTQAPERELIDRVRRDAERQRREDRDNY